MSPTENPRQSLESRLQNAKAEAQRQIEDGLIQGAVFAIGGEGPIMAVGNQCLHPQVRPMTERSRFDVASLGKVFTAGGCALLALDGDLELDIPFATYLPECVSADLRDVTVRDLAMHVGGFDNAKPYRSPDPAVFDRELFGMKPVRRRLEAFEYSCANFILLGKIIERVSGKKLEDFARERLWEPLAMKHTRWTPPGDGPDEVEHWNPNRPAGQHNDHVCFESPVPLGSGSCFSTAVDMRLFVEDIVKEKCFPAGYYDLITTCAFEKDGARRSFGWDMAREPRLKGLSDKTISHVGNTGQTIWADPGSGFSAVVLTSRTGNLEAAIAGRVRILESLCG